MIRIGSNIEALRAQRLLAQAGNATSRAFERLSSGMRINRASDDAAGLAISSTLRTQSRVYTQAVRNGNDALSALSIHDGALGELGSILDRLTELSTQAANGTLSTTQRVALDREGAELVKEYNRTLAATKFNNLSTLDGTLGQIGIQLGYGVNGGIQITLGQDLKRSVGAGFKWGSETDFSVGTIQRSILADMNHDGRDDLVRAADGQLTISYADTLGNFGVAETISVDNGSPTSVASGDLNGDGLVDLLVTDGNFSWSLLQQSDGSLFQPTSSTFLTGSPDMDRAGESPLADFNGDGILDLFGYYSGIAQVALGNGDGSFKDPTGESTVDNLLTYILKDFDGDGQIDVIGSTGAETQLFRGKGDGTFGAAETLATGTLRGLAVADFNYDGIMDLAATASGDTTKVWLGSGAGRVKSGVSIGSGNIYGDLRTGDFNGDGNTDLLLGGGAGGNGYFYLGNGDGSFQSGVSLGALYRDLWTGDINGDGITDFINSGDGNAVLYGLPNEAAVIAYLGVAATTTTIARLDLTTRDGAKAAITTLQTARERVSRERGITGALQSRISTAINVVQASRDNGEAAAARITDADIAQESAELTRQTLLQQTSAALMSQINQAPRLALDLLR